MIYFIVTIIIAFVILMSHKTWFPKNANIFRISKKQKGRITFYRSEVKRPFFGWTPFYASENNGDIFYSPTWSSEKQFSEKYIERYKNLKDL